MLVKQLNKAAVVSWCASASAPSLLASGTIAGTIDESFQTNSHLEFYRVDLGNLNQDMALCGSLVTKDCFHKVCFGLKKVFLLMRLS